MKNIPETVDRGKIAVGRFEVTRAQFAAFDGSYRYPAGTASYPATGITFEQAKAYCEWLSKQTGAKYRLGTEKEMGKMLTAKACREHPGRLGRVHGERRRRKRLAPVVAGLGEGALIRRVGSFPGEGDDPVYDLGGNAAEWVTTEDGKGSRWVAAPTVAADSKTATAPRPDYVGFRVVRDAAAGTP